jgi:peptide/nickel transport system substrate-binding protein/microcin C transport system substrate-binding protein
MNRRRCTGALAEEMLIPPDRSSVTFRIHPKARFYNRDPVIASDVKYSFDMLLSKEASPAYRTQLEGVSAITILDDRTIRFDLKDRTPDTIFNVGNMPIFSRKWAVGPDGKPKKFDEIVTEYPITSGPYTIGAVDGGRRIDFVLDKEYWARDLGFSKGQYNFQTVVYRYYRDNAVAMEAFKAGEFDFYMEYSARRWARLHQGPKWDDGRIIKEVFNNGFGMGFQSYVLNTRRPQLADPRVRKAINLAYDFEAVNVYKQYKHTNSMFANSEFAANGMPSPGELALLEPFRNELPPEVFGPAWIPRRMDASPNALRESLKEARDLLEQAGWKLGPDGFRRNAQGQLLEIEHMETGDAAGRAEAIFERNLAIIGIKYKPRLVDFALFRKRLETFDFDMVIIKIPDFTGAERHRAQGPVPQQHGHGRRFGQLSRGQEQSARPHPRQDGAGDDDGRAAGCDPRFRPRGHLQLVPGAGSVRRQQPRVALGQVRHPEGDPEVLHDRDTVRLAAVGDRGVVGQVARQEEELGPTRCSRTSASGCCS